MPDEPITYTVRVTNTSPVGTPAYVELTVVAHHRPSGTMGEWVKPWVLAPGESVSLDIPEGLLITFTED